MNPIPQDSQCRVISWLESLKSQRYPELESNTEITRPAAKRARHGDSTDVTFVDPYNAGPRTPPLTDGASMESPKTPPRRKRGNDEVDSSEDVGVDAGKPRLTALRSAHSDLSVEAEPAEREDTPTPRRREPSGKQIETEQERPKRTGKKRDTTGARSRAILSDLLKPLKQYPLSSSHDAIAKLPADVLSLYKRLYAARDRHQFIPHEVRDEVMELEPLAGPSWFRNPDPTDPDGTRAKAEFSMLSKIRFKATQSQIYERSESAWNNRVHTPILDLVFESDMPEPGHNVEYQVRCEPIMSADIKGSYIPYLQGPEGGPACSVSVDSVFQESEGASSATGASLGSDLSMSKMRSRSVRVDYVLALDIPEDAPLCRVIRKLVSYDLRSVNQTTYLPLRHSPIAMSIETKTDTSARDPILQLCIWTAAWYQRMYDLREDLIGAGPKPPLVSVPVVQIVGHTWQAYFICDRGSYFELLGPVEIGSTQDVLSLYGLLNALKAIKEWIMGPYVAGLEEWFICRPVDGQGRDVAVDSLAASADTSDLRSREGMALRVGSDGHT